MSIRHLMVNSPVSKPDTGLLTSAGIRNWYSSASSASGKYLAACVLGGYIYTSSDYGATWTPRVSAGSRQWAAVSMSADGSKLAACASFVGSPQSPGPGTGYIYTSSDFGATWIERTSAGKRQWAGISMSADGAKLLAATAYIPGGLPPDFTYTSTDSGETWAAATSLGTKDWRQPAVSADGSTMVMPTYGGYIYTSSNSGTSWVERVSSGDALWQRPAVSSDGSIILVAGNYVAKRSIDSGTSWSAVGGLPNLSSKQIYAAAMSHDATTQIIGINNDHIYISRDSGNTFNVSTVGIKSWVGVSCSADGSQILACTFGGELYIINNI